MTEQGRAAVLAWQQAVNAVLQRRAGLVAGSGQSDVDAARREFFGKGAPGSARMILQTNATTPGGQDGIILSRFFIANEKAAFGTLHGDGRGHTTDPVAGHRFAIAWDTRTGEVSLTVNQSTLIEGTRIGEGPVLSPETPPDVDVPALPITIGPDGAPNNFVVDETGPGHLKMSYNVLNSVYPMGQANGTVDIRLDPSTTTVHLNGDNYPDGEIVQYRPAGTRLLLTKDMSPLEELSVFPGVDSVDLPPQTVPR